jgi:hypothetical protein
MLPFSMWPTVPVSGKKRNIKCDRKPRCPVCAECYRISDHGCYFRYRFDSCEQMAVPRYCCRNPVCYRKTFSVLPLPYLPYCRIPLCILMVLYQRHVVEKQKISDCARWLGQTWNTVKRAANLAKRLIHWFKKETITGALALIPCCAPHWPAVTRAYSYSFLPSHLLPENLHTNR